MNINFLFFLALNVFIHLILLILNLFIKSSSWYFLNFILSRPVLKTHSLKSLSLWAERLKCLATSLSAYL